MSDAKGLRFKMSLRTQVQEAGTIPEDAFNYAYYKLIVLRLKEGLAEINEADDQCYLNDSAHNSLHRLDLYLLTKKLQNFVACAFGGTAYEAREILRKAEDFLSTFET